MERETHPIMASSSGVALLCLVAVFSLSALRPSSVSADQNDEGDPGLVVDFYKDSCPQAEEIIREQVRLLYKRHKNTAFSWLRNIFHDCAVQVYIYIYVHEPPRALTLFFLLPHQSEYLVLGRLISLSFVLTLLFKHMCSFHTAD